MRHNFRLGHPELPCTAMSVRLASFATMVSECLGSTSICIYIAKRRPPELASRFEGLRPGDVGVVIVTYGHLLFGAEKSQHLQPARERL